MAHAHKDDITFWYLMNDCIECRFVKESRFYLNGEPRTDAIKFVHYRLGREMPDLGENKLGVLKWGEFLRDAKEKTWKLFTCLQIDIVSAQQALN